MTQKKRLITLVSGGLLLTSCTVGLVWLNGPTTLQQTVQTTDTSQTSIDYNQIAQDLKNSKDPVVVGEVFENGYLQKHGNHYHFIYGKVPENAIFEEKSEHIINDNYQFNPKDIVSENDLGYVVKHGDHFHFVYKNKTTSPIMPTPQHIAEDHYTFNPNDIVSETEAGYVVRHGDHFHFIFKGTQPNTTLIHAQTKHDHDHEHTHDAPVKSDNHTLNVIHQNDILEETADGYVVKHDDHFHFVYKKDLAQTIITTPRDADENHSHDTSQHKPQGHVADDLHHETQTTPLVEKHQDSQDVLATKKAYVAKIYGVDVNHIRVTDEFFIFNDPGHAYDPTHIHPYAVRISALEIPAVTGIPEIDFENELLALAKRLNQAPHTIPVENQKFVLNHGNHNHYVYIQAVDGIKPYYDNKLPAITGDYMSGDFSKDTVLAKVDTLLQQAKDKFTNDALAYRRVERALDEFKSDLHYVSNSTTGYLKMLDTFHATHIDPTAVKPAPESKPTDSVYTELINTLKNLTVDKYHFTKQELLDTLKTAVDNNDQATIDRMTVTVNELKRIIDLPSPMVAEMAYLDYFLKHLEHESLTLEQREEIATLILEVFKTTTRHKERQFSFYELTPRLIASKATILHQKSQNSTHDIEIGEQYLALHTETSSPRVPKPYRLEISDLVNDMRDFIIEMNMATPDILNEGFTEPILSTPVGPTIIGLSKETEILQPETTETTADTSTSTSANTTTQSTTTQTQDSTETTATTELSNTTVSSSEAPQTESTHDTTLTTTTETTLTTVTFQPTTEENS